MTREGRDEYSNPGDGPVNGDLRVPSHGRVRGSGPGTHDRYPEPEITGEWLVAVREDAGRGGSRAAWTSRFAPRRPRGAVRSQGNPDFDLDARNGDEFEDVRQSGRRADGEHPGGDDPRLGAIVDPAW